MIFNNSWLISSIWWPKFHKVKSAKVFLFFLSILAEAHFFSKVISPDWIDLKRYCYYFFLCNFIVVLHLKWLEEPILALFLLFSWCLFSVLIFLPKWKIEACLSVEGWCWSQEQVCCHGNQESDSLSSCRFLWLLPSPSSVLLALRLCRLCVITAWPLENTADHETKDRPHTVTVFRHQIKTEHKQLHQVASDTHKPKKKTGTDYQLAEWLTRFSSFWCSQLSFTHHA